ncbi:hypothetical protein OCU04_001189 [Sclerotinia nivalis]|uniref:ZZ-type domain-containing protein n=1 Tax=Sclerotinia nivalis TaxID=352851 RepID=A0A9X0B0A5_9HELO|nr:hypothetical protein OCU04_001189 [Sclerotinia nivalis]
MDTDVNMVDPTREPQLSNLGSTDVQEHLGWEREGEREEEEGGEEIEEDDMGSEELDCDACNKSPITQWPTDLDDAGFHYCLDCPSVFLCDSCYKQQLRYHNGLDEGFWFQVCWARHEFLNAPIEGWVGVKKNVLTIGHNRILWKDWIQNVKNAWSKEMSKKD